MRGVRSFLRVRRPGMGPISSHGGAKSVTTYATWNPATVALATLSNGNLTFTNSTGGFNPCYAYTTSSKTVGKFVVQLTVVNKVDQNFAFGLGKLTLGSGMAADTNSCGGYADGNLYNNTFTLLGNIGAWVNADVITQAVDLGARLYWMRRNAGSWNNNGAANPDTGVGGFAFSSGMTGGSTLFIAGDAHTNLSSGTLNSNPAGTGLTTFTGWSFP